MVPDPLPTAVSVRKEVAEKWMGWFVLDLVECPSVSRTSAVARTFGPAMSEEYSPVVLARGEVADAYPLVVVESDTARVSGLAMVESDTAVYRWKPGIWITAPSSSVSGVRGSSGVGPALVSSCHSCINCKCCSGGPTPSG